MPSNDIIAIDFETFYDKEYSLRKMSTWAYVHDDRFDAYLVAVYGPEIQFVGAPKDFDWSLLNGKTVVAHNASFDEPVFQRLKELGTVPQDVEPKEFLCTADLAAYLGCKRDLKTASSVMLGEEISKDVRNQMKGKTLAEAEAQGIDVITYGGNDARLCWELADRFLDQWPEDERCLSVLNREAGIRGVALDLELIEKGHEKLATQLFQVERLIPWIDDGDKPLSPKAIRTQGRTDGIPVPASLAKDDPAVIAWEDEYGERYPWIKATRDYRRINMILQRVKTLRDSARADGTMAYQMKYGGAHTLRFSGGGDSGGKFNLQNIPKFPMFGVDLRPMLVARPGHVYVISDFAQVEARVLLWRVGDTRMLDAIKVEGNLYQAYAKTNGTYSGTNMKGDDPLGYALAKAQCLTAETLVLTNHGYKRIVEVMRTDLVWDGLDWVAHNGVVCNGYRDSQSIINYHGEGYTDDHGVFVHSTGGDGFRVEPAGTVLARHTPTGAVAWRQTPGSEWHDIWLLARAVHSAIFLTGKQVRRVSMRAVQTRVRRCLVKLAKWKKQTLQYLQSCAPQTSAQSKTLGNGAAR